MEAREYVVVYEPFPMSDAWAEIHMSGADEDDVRLQFERYYPLWRLKEIRPR